MTDRSSNVAKAGQAFNDNINRSLRKFYSTYSKYLGEDADKLSRNIDPAKPVDNLVSCVALVRKILSDGPKTSSLLVFKGSTYSLMNTTLPPMTFLNPTAILGMVPQSNELQIFLVCDKEIAVSPK
jgi:hypothetical protein